MRVCADFDWLVSASCGGLTANSSTTGTPTAPLILSGAGLVGGTADTGFVPLDEQLRLCPCPYPPCLLEAIVRGGAAAVTGPGLRLVGSGPVVKPRQRTGELPHF